MHVLKTLIDFTLFSTVAQLINAADSRRLRREVNMYLPLLIVILVHDKIATKTIPAVNDHHDITKTTSKAGCCYIRPCTLCVSVPPRIALQLRTLARWSGKLNCMQQAVQSRATWCEGLAHKQFIWERKLHIDVHAAEIFGRILTGSYMLFGVGWWGAESDEVMKSFNHEGSGYSLEL